MKNVLLLASLALALVAGAADPVRTAVFASGNGACSPEVICGLSGKPNPKVLIFPTAGKDDPKGTEGLCKGYSAFSTNVHAVLLFSLKPKDVAATRQDILTADVMWFCGGYTERIVERLNVFDLMDDVREAYRRGAVIAGSSAGIIIQAHSGYNDFLDGRWDLCPGMGLVPCYVGPHYQGKVWQGMDKCLERVLEHRSGPKEGWAIEDGIMIVFRNEQPEIRRYSEKAHCFHFARTDKGWVKTDRTPAQVYGGK